MDIYISLSLSIYKYMDSSLGGALNALKFQCAQRDSLSELFLQEKMNCIITSARELLRETLRSSERFHFAPTRIKASIKSFSTFADSIFISSTVRVTGDMAAFSAAVVIVVMTRLSTIIITVLVIISTIITSDLPP